MSVSVSVKIKEDGMHVSGKEGVKGIWMSHFERLMNEMTDKEAIVPSIRVEASAELMSVLKTPLVKLIEWIN